MAARSACTKCVSLRADTSGLQIDVSDLATHASDRHCMKIRNTFIDIDEATTSPVIGRKRAQTLTWGRLHANDTGDAIEDNQIHKEIIPVLPEERSSTLITTCSDEVSDSDEYSVSALSGETLHGSDRHKARPLTVRNTFIDVDDDEDVATPQQRQDRAHTWHGNSSFCDDSDSSANGEEVVSHDSAFSELASCTPTAFTESLEQEHLSSLAQRVHAPPPLGRIDSPVNGLCASPPGTVSTSASSNGQACQLELASLPSVTSKASGVHASGCAGSLDLPQCSNGILPQGFFQIPSIFASTGATLTSAMPHYAFAYPPFAFVPMPNAGVFAGLAHHQCPTQDVLFQPETCNANGTSAAPSQDLRVGCPLLPSIGSAGHHKGMCKPCAFGIDRCKNKQDCEFCHICKPNDKSKRGRWVLKRRKNREELQTELLDLQHALHGSKGTHVKIA